MRTSSRQLKLVISCKFWETQARRKYKGRIVALGHLFWEYSTGHISFTTSSIPEGVRT